MARYIFIAGGVMSGIGKGEVFVTDDGLECDQDIGNYKDFWTRICIGIII